MLTLYPESLFICLSRIFLCRFFKILQTHDHIFCKRNTVLPFSFPYICFLFFSFALIILARISSKILSQCGQRGHLCVVPDFRRNMFNVSQLNMMLAIGFCMDFLNLIISRRPHLQILSCWELGLQQMNGVCMCVY